MLKISNFILIADLFEKSKALKTLEELLGFAIITRSDTSQQNQGPPLRSFETSQRKTRPTLRNCFVLDLFDKGSIETVFFKFEENLTGSVQILMESSTLFTDRDLSVQSQYKMGHDIVVPLKTNLVTGSVQKTYDVMLSKNTYVENDPTKGCRNYPTENFPSYNDCDKDFVQKQLDKIVGKRFRPFWAVDDFAQVSATNVTSVETTQVLAIFDGSKTSNCPLPCQTASMRTLLFSEQFNEAPIIQINFASLVPVSKTDFIKFDLVEFLSDIGGSLGLWLGLGVLQLLEVFLEAAPKVRAKFATKKQNNLVKKV